MTTLSEEFERRVKGLDARAKAAGTNMTQICKTTGLTRVTYERWVNRPPQSVFKLDELEAAVARAEEAAKAKAA